MTAPAFNAPLIPLKAAAKLLMTSDVKLRALARAGYIPMPKRGKTTLVGAVQGYIRALKDEERGSSLLARTDRLSAARAEEIQLRVDLRRRDLLPAEDVNWAATALAATIRSEFASLAARTTRDMVFRREIEQEVHAALNRIADGLNAMK